MSMATWLDFWDGDHSIYVSERHRQAHADEILADIKSWLPDHRPTVLDFGCGEARYSEELATHCERLILCDGAKQVRHILTERLRTGAGLRDYCSRRDGFGRARLRRSGRGQLGALQYLDSDELDRLIERSRAMLAPRGRLLLADVIPPDIGMLTDAVALLRFGWRAGFIVPAVVGLVRTALSDYRHYRREIGLTTHAVGDLIRRLDRFGLEADLAPRNFGHNQARYTLVAEVRDATSG